MEKQETGNWQRRISTTMQGTDRITELFKGAFVTLLTLSYQQKDILC